MVRCSQSIDLAMAALNVFQTIALAMMANRSRRVRAMDKRRAL